VTVLLVADHDNKLLGASTAKAMSAARALGGDVHVLVAGAGCEPVAQAAAKLDGAAKVLLADAPQFEHQLAEELARLISGLMVSYDAVLAPSTAVGKNIMPRVAALLDVMQISDIIKVVPEAEALDDAETLAYLHGTISDKRQPVAVPAIPPHLDAILCDAALLGGVEPKLGDQHLRVLTVLGFPNATTPGLLDALNDLGFAYRWTTRWIALDKTDATKCLTRLRR
jgi:hypothetical protein